MLSLQLKELEEGNFVERIVAEGNPPKIDYKLTQMAIEMIPALSALESYGRSIIGLKSKNMKPTKLAMLNLSSEEESFFDQL
jgi:DNA-binding HxlR family transcriptional regulator